MPIDGVKVPRSPAWWTQRLFNRLGNRQRSTRLQLLHDYHRGNAPLPQGADNAREAFEAFQRKARTNFAELIVSAASERMTPVGFRTALDDDETGDAEVGALWERAGLDVEANNVHDLMLTLGEAYVIVGAFDEEIESPIVTAEDPRYMVSEPDPMYPQRLQAVLKVIHDDVEGQDRAYLYLPGEIHVAVRPTRVSTIGPTGPIMNFNPSGWNWDAERSSVLPHDRIPVVRFLNKDGLGEYEAHTDLLDRINHQLLQRMVIATMQAFRQRAIKGLDLVDAAGNEIDYTGVFTSDPAALWQLPEKAQMWESAQVDLTPILSAVKDDVQHLAAATRTPMHMLMPAGVNQSAEGASMQREGLVFKVRDRITRSSHPWARVMSLALIAADQSERADLAQLRTIWAPPEHLSLAERADAASKAKDDIPRRSRLIHIWGFSPAEADRMMSEVADDVLLQQQILAATGPAVTATPPVAVPTPPAAPEEPAPAEEPEPAAA